MEEDKDYCSVIPIDLMERVFFYHADISIIIVEVETF